MNAGCRRELERRPVGWETAWVSADRLEALSDDYESAEAHWLMPVRTAAEREALAAAARAVAAAAEAFNAEAYRKYHAGKRTRGCRWTG
jgi:hypothetical protein